MADYNVNMKQWNGTSFDNVLPLAFNSKALEGKSYDDIVQYVQSFVGTGGENILATWGTYIGNGKYGSSNSNIITCNFTPCMIALLNYSDSVFSGCDFAIKSYNHFSNYYYHNEVSWLNNGVKWFTTNTSSSAAQSQYNVKGVNYPYIIFGYQNS